MKTRVNLLHLHDSTYSTSMSFFCYCRLKDGTVVPAVWYKLLVWCDNGLQAEYILTPQEENVSFIAITCQMIVQTFFQSRAVIKTLTIQLMLKRNDKTLLRM